MKSSTAAGFTAKIRLQNFNSPTSTIEQLWLGQQTERASCPGALNPAHLKLHRTHINLDYFAVPAGKQSTEFKSIADFLICDSFYQKKDTL